MCFDDFFYASSDKCALQDDPEIHSWALMAMDIEGMFPPPPIYRIDFHISLGGQSWQCQECQI